ncbi:MAG TPA: type I DNA topoisomerase [Firmicutes bacterium]|nr:type I DNA topoisomerase [Bacillota bacterium]
MKLVVIEGVGKKPAIQKYLGSGYKVFATMGHVRDLPAKTLAVDVNDNFKPTYKIMPDKQKVVDELKTEAGKAEDVLLATDPDREGEAISWHIATILGIPEDKKARITFNEISKKAITKALEEPRAIDKNLVDAQQARRVLDRLVGYKVSPVLCTKIQNKLSAGRVQSVTLRLVFEREREIQNFKPEEYWPFFSVLEGRGGAKIKASLATRKGEKYKIGSAAEVEEVKAALDGRPYVVGSVKKSIAYSHAPAPFRTSTMQQDAINKLGMSLKQVTQAAQALYEGVDIPGEGKVALITYIRTDSTRVSPEAAASAREYITSVYGADYVPAKPNVYASKGNVQDAHEAIRPISVQRTPDSLKDSVARNYYRLYKLIYERFLASQMSSAQYNSLTADIACGDYGFRVTGKTPLFAGYTKVYSEKDEKDEDEMKKLPDMNEGETLGFIEYVYEQKFTKPPARYTEASLIKAMEEKGIGRPATYQPTVSLLETRAYTEREGKAIKPTELGFKVVDMLIKYFPDIMDVKFTADMETKLDTIEDGGKVWQQIVAEFYTGFEDELKKAMGDGYKMKAPAVETDYKCEKCGAPMVIREGRFGRFLACSAYPKCKNTKQIDENGNIKEKAEPVVVESDVICEKCGARMVVKTSARGKFLACPNYPKCRNTKELEDEEKLPDCPVCGKPLKKINYYRGAFYGCSGYPDCKFALYDKPIDKKCPQCGSLLVVKKRKDGLYHKCSNKECTFMEKAPDETT